MLGSGGKLETGHRGRGHGYIVGINVHRNDR